MYDVRRGKFNDFSQDRLTFTTMRKRIPKKNVAFKGKHLISKAPKEEPVDQEYLKKLQLIEDNHYDLGEFKLEELLALPYNELLFKLHSIKASEPAPNEKKDEE